MSECEWYGCKVDHDKSKRSTPPLRWHKCVGCGWQDLAPVGSKPWKCHLCVKKEKDNG